MKIGSSVVLGLAASAAAFVAPAANAGVSWSVDIATPFVGTVISNRPVRVDRRGPPVVYAPVYAVPPQAYAPVDREPPVVYGPTYRVPPVAYAPTYAPGYAPGYAPIYAPAYRAPPVVYAPVGEAPVRVAERPWRHTHRYGGPPVPYGVVAAPGYGVRPW